LSNIRRTKGYLHAAVLIPEDVDAVVTDEVAAVPRPQAHPVDGVLLLRHLLLLEHLLLGRLVLHTQGDALVPKGVSGLLEG